jgi:hypothetical protein
VKWLFAIVLSVMASSAILASAAENAWPQLAPGESKVIEDINMIPAKVLAAAGLDVSAARRGVNFTFFKAPHGRDFVIIAPCCGDGGQGTALFQLADGTLKPVELVLGDPRLGFTAQGHASGISVDAGVVALRARIEFNDCENGVWGYYYRFGEGDRLTLLSVIDTSCEHLGVRELYHVRDVDVGHWWQK